MTAEYKEYKSAYEIAKNLVEIYKKEFGGKNIGRFRISYDGLCEIAGREHIKETVKSDIISEACDLGFVVTEFGKTFYVIEQKIMNNYRKVPKRILKHYK